MRNAGLEEAQAGIKIARKNINNLRYANNTTLITESKGELKRLLMKEESEKVGVKFNIQKKDYGIQSHHFMANRWGNNINSDGLNFGPTLTSLHDYWKNHSFDYTDLCRQSDVSAF